VNFVLHLHLAARDLASPGAGAGAMLPDLWRMADRRVRAQPLRPLGDNPALDAALAGIEHHLDVDRWFHADPAFTEGEREAARLLREAHLTAPRIGLFAHVLWELCLDGALLRREGLERVLDLLRRGVAELGPDTFERTADLHHFSRVAREASERATFAARLTRILAELERGPWIEGYQHGSGIAALISGVRRGVGLSPLVDADAVRLAAVAEALLARAPGALERIDAETGGRKMQNRK
jgi:hypothetical protein